METTQDERFGGMARLYGPEGLEVLARASVAVIGIGGVGSWTAEALARSDIGHITLVDADDICVTNTNRQIHALCDTVGQPKVEAMAERIRRIHPECRVSCEYRFFSESTAEALLAPGFDFVVDAIDSLQNKCLLIDSCRRKGIPLVVSGGAGGRTDPTRIHTDDLARARQDALLKLVRKRLRQRFGFSRDTRENFGIPCVYTLEAPHDPRDAGQICAPREPGESLKLDCASGYGAATFVTGAMGFAAAAVVVNTLARQTQ